MQYLFLTGIILSAFHSFVLFSKNDKRLSDYVLALWFCFSGISLFSFFLVYSDKHLIYPSLTVLGMPFPLLIGPLLLLYTKYQTTTNSFKKSDLLHVFPFAIVFFFFVNIYFLPFESRSEILRSGGRGYEMQGFIKLLAIYISGMVYIPWSAKKLLDYKKNINNQFSNTERINFNWLLYLIIGMAIVWIIILFVQDDRFIFGAVSLFIIWMSYFGTKQVQIFRANSFPSEEEEPHSDICEENNRDAETPRYSKSSLNVENILEIHAALIKVLNEKQPYLNPELKLTDLAVLLGVHPNHLSQVINSQCGKSFYDLINERRIQEFIFRLKQKESKQYTLVALAFDCGFNSKASFNRNFKKYTQLTPSDYYKISMQQIETYLPVEEMFI
jgi:AraC-like DNA-binding protein